MPIVIEFVVGALLLWALVTQIALPAWRGTRLFPSFSKERREVVERGTEVREARDLQSLAEEISGDQKKLTAPRRQPHKPRA